MGTGTNDDLTPDDVTSGSGRHPMFPVDHFGKGFPAELAAAVRQELDAVGARRCRARSAR